jgi:hypothetical protein
MGDTVHVEQITPAPTPAEVAAIVAAVEALWPRPVVVVEEELAASPVWRFSGRWWRKPIAARRDRPW